MGRGIVETLASVLAAGLGSAQSKEPMKITDQHRKKLCHLLHHALIEMRVLGWAGKSGQAADLADAFHELPKDMWQLNLASEREQDVNARPWSVSSHG
jgi:hypothetical protein